MAEKDCLNNENELNSSIIGSNEVQSQLNIDNLSSELGENSDISSILAIDDINSEMNPDLSTDSNLSENNQVESELDIPVSIQGEIPEIPTKLSEFENDVGFITLEDIPEYPEKLSEFVNDGDGSSPFATEAFVLQNAGSGGESGPTVPVVDNLTSLSTTSALSANQGRVLNEKITEVEENIPTNISDLNNDAGFVSKTVSDLENYTTTDKMNEALNNKADRTEIPDISGKVDKSELTDYVSKEELQKENFLKEIPSEYVTEEELSSAISNKADKSDIPDISGKADKSEIPDISGLATKTEVQSKSEETLNSANDYTDTKVAELIDSAPETLDTFKEIADAFAEDQEVLDTLNSAIGLKADKTALTETNLRVSSLEENKADKSEIPDISGKADKSELSNYVTNTALEGKGYLTEIPTEYVTESELTAKDYATNTTVNGKLGKTENAVSATKATQDGDGKVIKNTYIKLDGSNYLVRLSQPSDNNNVGGWRHIATCTLAKWSYAHLILTIKSRHSGNGLLTIGICETNGNLATVVASIRFYGSTDATMYTNAWKMIYNTITNVVNVYWRFGDYNSCEIKVLSQDRFTTNWNNGEWLTTEPTAGENEIEYLPIIYDKEYLPLTGGTMSGAIDMGNFDITNANKITFADAGYGEGIEWNQGNGWRINECPNDLTNAKGNLQFISSNTRRATIGTDGKVEATGGFTFPNTTSTYINGNKGTNVAINMTANVGYNVLSRIKSTNGVFTQGVHSGDCKLMYTADSVISAGTNGVTKMATLLNESGNSTFPGIVYSNIHAYKNSSFGRGDTAGPSSNIYNQPFQVRDKNEKTIAAVETGVMTNRRTMINMICYKGTSATDNANARIEVGWNSDGTAYTYCGATPPITSNDNQIATTGWIRKVDAMAGNNDKDTNNDGVVDKVPKQNQHDTVVEYWMASDKLSWYRLWASGWLEQGVWITGSTSTEKNIVLPKAYGNTDYNIETSIYYSSSSAPSGSGNPTFNTVYNLLPMLFNQRKDGFKTNRYNSNNIYYSFYCCGVITT